MNKENENFEKHESMLYGTSNKAGVEINKKNFPYISQLVNELYISQNSNRKYGAFDKFGDIIIPFKYDRISVDKKNNIVINNEEKYGIISNKGKILLPCKYECGYMEYFEKNDFNFGLLKVTKNNKKGFVNSVWKEVVPCKYNDFDAWTSSVQLEMIQNQMIIVVNRSNFSYKYNLYGVVKLSNPEKFLIRCKYSSIELLQNKFFKVSKNGYGLLDTDGKTILPCVYNSLIVNKLGFITVSLSSKKTVKHNRDEMYENMIRALDKNTNQEKYIDPTRYGIYNSFGKEILPCIFERIDDIDDDGYVVIKQNSKFGVFNVHSGFIIPIEYESILSYSEGIAIFFENNKCGCIDKNNKVIIKPEYDWINPFCNGLAGVMKYNKWGFIDSSNKLIVNFKYGKVYNFNEGLCAVEFKKKWGFIDKEGKIVVDFKYNRVESFSNGLAYVNQIFNNDLYENYIDKTGKTVGEDKIYRDSTYYTNRELGDLLYDAFEGDQDAYDEWTQR